MPLLCNHHVILGKEQIPPMLQTLVNQYTSRGSSNTNSKAQPNDAFKSGKHNAKMKHCHLADKLLEWHSSSCLLKIYCLYATYHTEKASEH